MATKKKMQCSTCFYYNEPYCYNLHKDVKPNNWCKRWIAEKEEKKKT